MWIYHIFLIHQLMGIGFFSFHILVTMNNSIMNIYVQIFMWMYISISLGYVYLRMRLLGHAVTLYLTLRNCQTVAALFYIHQQRMRVLPFPDPCQHLLLSFFLIIAILVDVKWYLVTGTDMHFLMAQPVKHLFMCWTFMYLLWKIVYLDPLPHFKIRLVVFLLLNCRSSL